MGCKYSRKKDFKRDHKREVVKARTALIATTPESTASFDYDWVASRTNKAKDQKEAVFQMSKLLSIQAVREIGKGQYSTLSCQQKLINALLRALEYHPAMEKVDMWVDQWRTQGLPGASLMELVGIELACACVNSTAKDREHAWILNLKDVPQDFNSMVQRLLVTLDSL